MNNIASITRHLEERFPDHHVVLTEFAWPLALTYELIGPRTWASPHLDALIHITGCKDTQLVCTLESDDSGNNVTTITVRA